MMKGYQLLSGFSHFMDEASQKRQMDFYMFYGLE